MIVYAAESLYCFNTTEPPYLIKGLPTSLESRHTTGCKSNLCGADLEGGGASNLTGGGSGANVDWGGASCFHSDEGKPFQSPGLVG